MYNLPIVLSWLENTVMELWIDQEGFRLIQPAFKLSGYTSVSSDDPATDLVNALTHGTAEFVPVNRQAYFFHYAPLDPPPVLRKLTMADDDTRDYISRQATLAIKTNGVYSVSGTESFDCGPPSPRSPTNHGHAPLRLMWRFEYLVDDRHPDAARKRQVEKTLTPLSFSCSPGLLHPTHGKKIRLMQVVKKAIAPKLSAAILPSTGEAPNPVNVPLSIPVHVSPGTQAQLKGKKGETRVAKLLHVAHRRAHSTATELPVPGDDHRRAMTEGIRAGAKKGRATSMAMVPLLRRSDDGGSEESVPVPLPREPAGQLQRHILPASEIAHMLDNTLAPRSGDNPQRSLLPPLRRPNARPCTMTNVS